MSWFSSDRETLTLGGQADRGCQNCGGFETDGRGNCVGCGRVITEFQGSEDIQFSGTGHKVGTSYEAGVRPGGDREIGNTYDRYAVGRAAIRKLTSALNCTTDNVVTKAEATYRLAVVYDFVKAGRPVAHVAAACVYVACRKARWPVLLMDVSQILQMNLFKLGRLVKKLCVALHQKLNTCPLLAAYGTNEYVDASLYVARFVRKLEFGEGDVQRVTNLACRVLQKMQNDWIQCGRHPAGLFGASIVIAARLLGYNRTHKEVARHVFIAGVTIGKRVYEFAQSTAGEMTLNDFEDRNFGTSANPPAFTRGLKKLQESEVPTPDVQAWLDLGNKTTTFSSVEHADDEPISDSELDGYILDNAEHKDEIQARESMYSLQYGDWEVEKAQKVAEKLRVKEEKKANRKRKRLPKNVRAAKKARSEELSKLALNDPNTASLFQELGKSVSVTPAKILADDDIKEEPIEDLKETKNDTTPTKFDTENKSNTENNHALFNTNNSETKQYDDDEMSDVSECVDDYDFDFDAQARDRASEDEFDVFDDDIGWG